MLKKPKKSPNRKVAPRQGLQYWLAQYAKIQKEILVVYHPTNDSRWERAPYLGEGYNAHVPYNHRSILESEVVIEFDGATPEENRRLADKVSERLSKDGFAWSKWTSGNKSTHLHTFVVVGSAADKQLIKRVFTRYYTRDLGVLPDLQLCAPNHLIRAEYGVHEKTGRVKQLISTSGEYPTPTVIPDAVWEIYRSEVRARLGRQVVRNSGTLKEHKGFKYLLTTHEFQRVGDGHERALFLLIHTLKHEYVDRKNELVKFLQDWYKYSGGVTLSPEQIRAKVVYGLSKSYSPGVEYLERLLEELNLEHLKEKEEKQ